MYHILTSFSVSRHEVLSASLHSWLGHHAFFSFDPCTLQVLVPVVEPSYQPILLDCPPI